jgi:hypothetical protein
MEKNYNIEKPKIIDEPTNYVNYLYEASKKVKDTMNTLDKKTLKEIRATYERIMSQKLVEKQQMHR